VLNYFVVRDVWMVRFYPELHCACTGYPRWSPPDFCT